MRYFLSTLLHRAVYKFTDKADIRYYANKYLKGVGLYKSPYDNFDDIDFSEGFSDAELIEINEERNFKKVVVPIKGKYTITNDKFIIKREDFKEPIKKKKPSTRTRNLHRAYGILHDEAIESNETDEVHHSYNVQLVYWKPELAYNGQLARNGQTSAITMAEESSEHKQGQGQAQEGEQAQENTDLINMFYDNNTNLDDEMFRIMIGNQTGASYNEHKESTEQKHDDTSCRYPLRYRIPYQFIFSPSHLIANRHIVNWSFISKYCSMNIQQLDQLKYYLDWKSLIKYQLVPWNIIRTFLPYIKISWIAARYKIPLSFILVYIKQLSTHDCSYIVQNQYVDEDIIDKFIDKFDINTVLQYQKMSQQFINKHLLKCNFRLLYTYQTLDANFIREHHEKLNIKHLLFTSDVPEDILQLYLDQHIIRPSDIARSPYIPLKFLDKYMRDPVLAEILENTTHELKKIRLVYCPNQYVPEIEEERRIDISTLYIGQSLDKKPNSTLVLELDPVQSIYNGGVPHSIRSRLSRSLHRRYYQNQRNRNDVDWNDPYVVNGEIRPRTQTSHIDRQKTGDLAKFQWREAYYNSLSEENKRLHNKIYNQMFNSFLYDPNNTEFNQSRVMTKLSDNMGVTLVETSPNPFDVYNTINVSSTDYTYATVDVTNPAGTNDDDNDEITVDNTARQNEITVRMNNLLTQRNQTRTQLNENPGRPDTVLESSIHGMGVSHVYYNNTVDSLENATHITTEPEIAAIVNMDEDENNEMLTTYMNSALSDFDGSVITLPIYNEGDPGTTLWDDYDRARQNPNSRESKFREDTAVANNINANPPIATDYHTYAMNTAYDTNNSARDGPLLQLTVDPSELPVSSFTSPNTQLPPPAIQQVSQEDLNNPHMDIREMETRSIRNLETQQHVSIDSVYLVVSMQTSPETTTFITHMGTVIAPVSAQQESKDEVIVSSTIPNKPADSSLSVSNSDLEIDSSVDLAPNPSQQDLRQRLRQQSRPSQNPPSPLYDHPVNHGLSGVSEDMNDAELAKLLEYNMKVLG